MKTFAFFLTRLDLLDPLTVRVVKNDLGCLPTWTVDAPSTYTATFPVSIGMVPTQITTGLSEVFFHAVVQGSGPVANAFSVNTMIDDSNVLEAGISDLYIEVRILDEVEQSS